MLLFDAFSLIHAVVKIIFMRFLNSNSLFEISKFTHIVQVAK